jgi:hypothetical protein
VCRTLVIAQPACRVGSGSHGPCLPATFYGMQDGHQGAPVRDVPLLPVTGRDCPLTMASAAVIDFEEFHAAEVAIPTRAWEAAASCGNAPAMRSAR